MVNGRPRIPMEVRRRFWELIQSEALMNVASGGDPAAAGTRWMIPIVSRDILG
jgi:hypothetical protein